MGKDFDLQAWYIILYSLDLFKGELPPQNYPLYTHVVVHLGSLGIDTVGLGAEMNLLVWKILFKKA